MKKTQQLVDLDVWYRIHQVLIEAKENSIELMEQHYTTDRMTKREKFVLDMFEKEVREISDLLMYTSDNNGVPF